MALALLAVLAGISRLGPDLYHLPHRLHYIWYRANATPAWTDTPARLFGRVVESTGRLSLHETLWTSLDAGGVE
jgi:hypothetical protein